MRKGDAQRCVVQAGNFMLMKASATIICIGLCLAIARMSHAQGTLTLTFDEFSLLPNETDPIPNGYAGLQWANFLDMDAENSFQGPYGSGYLNGVISPNNVIWNGNGNPAQISSSTALFDLDSAYLTAAWMDGLEVEAQGFIGGTLAYDKTYTINTTSPTLIAFNYFGVDRVNFIGSGGTEHYPQGWGPEFVIDNLTVTVPEPNGVKLLLLGVACIGAIFVMGAEKVVSGCGLRYGTSMVFANKAKTRKVTV